MRFVAVNLLGVYVAPISVMLVAAWAVIIGLRLRRVRISEPGHTGHKSLETGQEA